MKPMSASLMVCPRYVSTPSTNPTLATLKIERKLFFIATAVRPALFLVSENALTGWRMEDRFRAVPAYRRFFALFLPVVGICTRRSCRDLQRLSAFRGLGRNSCLTVAAVYSFEAARYRAWRL